MCLIAIAYRIYDDCPVAVAANREEYFDRPGLPPDVVDRPGIRLRAMYGQDTRAGGTWLGVNERGLFVAVTNFWFIEPPSEARSRGALALDLLNCSTARQAAELAAAELATGRYAGVNYVCLDAASAHVVSHGPTLESIALAPGLHVVTNGRPDDLTDVRQNYFRRLFAERAPSTTAEFVAATSEILGRGSGVYGDETILLRAADRGTVSSSIVLLPRRVANSRWLFAPAAPDRAAYDDLSPKLQALLAAQAAVR